MILLFVEFLFPNFKIITLAIMAKPSSSPAVGELLFLNKYVSLFRLVTYRFYLALSIRAAAPLPFFSKHTIEIYVLKIKVSRNCPYPNFCEHIEN